MSIKQQSCVEAMKLVEMPESPPECQTEAEKTAFAFGWFKALEAQRPMECKPLTDERILEILGIHLDEDDDIEDWRSEINEARAIEAAHGIYTPTELKE